MLWGQRVWGSSLPADRVRLGYGIALTLVILLGIIRWFLNPLLQETGIFLLFTPAVMAASWYGGLGPGLAATVLSCLVGAVAFLPPELRIAPDSLDDFVYLGSFAIVGVLISALNAIRLRAEHEVRESEQRFRVAIKSAPIVVFNQDLELRFTWMYNPVHGMTGRAYAVNGTKTSSPRRRRRQSGRSSEE